MSKRRVIIAAVVVVAVIGVAGYAASRQRSATMVHEGTAADEARHADKPAAPGALATSGGDHMASESSQSPGTYSAYDAAKLADAKTGKVVIFFAASWCPDCRALDANITANLAKLPTGFTILKANYDQELKLRQKYGVTYQHTLVRVDQDGRLIKKWSGSFTLVELLGQAS